ncbi:hypothetical protein [Anoxybacillus kestanbolensis]
MLKQLNEVLAQEIAKGLEALEYGLTMFVFVYTIIELVQRFAEAVM